MEGFSGTIVGYDPGGNSQHGFAVAKFESGKCLSLQLETLVSTEQVIDRLAQLSTVSAIGIDTLAVWATGPSGWRSADLWMRNNYSLIHKSIVSPNGLYGSMGLNGMTVLIELRHMHPAVLVTETHPKVLYWALEKTKYHYQIDPLGMDKQLSKRLGLDFSTKNDHEWDAAISVLAAFEGFWGGWTHDLYEESLIGTGKLVYPAGQANYWWPE